MSSQKEHRKDVIVMGEWLLHEMNRLNISTKRVEVGEHEMDGETLILPPVILGSYGNDPKKKTLLVYGL